MNANVQCQGSFCNCAQISESNLSFRGGSDPEIWTSQMEIWKSGLTLPRPTYIAIPDPVFPVFAHLRTEVRKHETQIDRSRAVAAASGSLPPERCAAMYLSDHPRRHQRAQFGDQ